MAQLSNAPAFVPSGGTVSTFVAPPLTDAEFDLFRKRIYQEARIHLSDAKKPLVSNRLSKRLRILGLHSYREYYDFVASQQGRDELVMMVDALTTNKTEFFREPRHWIYLRDVLWPRLLSEHPAGGTVRIWSAGCSSGEEPYSIALSFHKNVPKTSRVRLQLLASDISTRVLEQAKAGRYDASVVESIPRETLNRYFSRSGDQYVAGEALKSLIRFERINLAEPFHWLKEPFDVIFCRNVIIYFDTPTKQDLMNKYHRALRPNGHLFLGHSETLNGLQTGFSFIAPTIYRK